MSQEISELRYEDVRKQIGHYKKMDYHPEIRPAGVVVLGEELKNCFKEYKLEDGIVALKSALHIREKRKESELLNDLSRIGSVNSGIYTGVKSCLEMNKLTPFQTVITELRDTAMNSYWKKEVGKIPDQTPNLPDGMDPILTTFGKIVKSTGTVAELVSPPKTATEVIKNSCIGHSLYKKSHNDYYPSEQVNREYVEPFNRNYKYGKVIKSDKLGGRIRRSMRWLNEDVATTISSLQARFLEDTQPRLGSTVVRADIAPLLDARTFGKLTERELYGVGELLRNSKPDTNKPIQRRYLAHINMLRLGLKKRQFSFSDLYQTFVYYDRDKSRMMTIEETYRILAIFKVHPDRILFEKLLNTLNLVNNGKVIYKDITDLLSWKCDFPLLPKIDDVPSEHQYYCSTYKDTICDVKFPNEKPSYAAGLCTERVDVPCAVVPPGRPRCERESLGDQTSMAAILSPNIFTQAGLSHLDFFQVRNADEIRTLFEDIGMDFTQDSFNIIWNEGLKKDCTGGVCIETFRGLLDQLAAATCEEIPIV